MQFMSEKLAVTATQIISWYDVALTRTENRQWNFLVIACYYASFGAYILVENVDANNIFASSSPADQKIVGAHIKRLHHEPAACWDNDAHLCLIILSISGSGLESSK